MVPSRSEFPLPFWTWANSEVLLPEYLALATPKAAESSIPADTPADLALSSTAPLPAVSSLTTAFILRGPSLFSDPVTFITGVKSFPATSATIMRLDSSNSGVPRTATENAEASSTPSSFFNGFPS